MLQTEWKQLASEVDAYMLSYLQKTFCLPHTAVIELKEALLYSAASGGKKFRPSLSLLIGKSFNKDSSSILPFACALEMIHCFSLIHDDLPALDNDDLRRGQPSLHKKFNEALAILSGDALLNQAYALLAQEYKNTPCLADVILLLSSATREMIEGQCIDLKMQKQMGDLSALKQLHALKTGALIRVSCEAAALIAQASPEEREAVKVFGENLGIAFQVKDDLIEASENKIEMGSYPYILGVPASQEILNDLSAKAKQALLSSPNDSPLKHALLLIELVDFNLQRKH